MGVSSRRGRQSRAWSGGRACGPAGDTIGICRTIQTPVRRGRGRNRRTKRSRRISIASAGIPCDRIGSVAGASCGRRSSGSYCWSDRWWRLCGRSPSAGSWRRLKWTRAPGRETGRAGPSAGDIASVNATVLVDPNAESAVRRRPGGTKQPRNRSMRSTASLQAGGRTTCRIVISVLVGFPWRNLRRLADRNSCSTHVRSYRRRWSPCHEKYTRGYFRECAAPSAGWCARIEQ